MRFPFAIEILGGAAIALHALSASSGEVLLPVTRVADTVESRLTIGQAIVIAEDRAGGEAIEAELNRKGGRLIYDVDVETASGAYEVLIDSATGTVLSIERDD